MSDAPPAWADTWLRLLLPVRDRDTVSGDLMEEYRESVRPQRSRLSADTWYVGQVTRFAWWQGLWALALAALFEARTAFDWFVPTTSFAPRSEVTTLVTVVTLLVIGASSTMRTRSFKAGVVSTATALIGSALICSAVTTFMYWYWRNPELIAAINGSGGLAEVITLPVILIVPGTLIGGLGAFSASMSHKQERATD